MNILAAILLLLQPFFPQYVPVPFNKGGGGGGPSFIQGCAAAGAFTTNPSTTIALGTCGSALAPTNGDHIRLYEAFTSNPTSVTTPTGCVASWTLSKSDSTTTLQWVYTGTASGGSCTITGAASTSGSTGMDMIAVEDRTSNAAVDNWTAQTIAFCTSCTMSPGLTTAANNEMLYWFKVGNGTVSAVSPCTLDSNVSNISSGSGHTISEAHCVVPTTTTTTVTWTDTNSSTATEIAF